MDLSIQDIPHLQKGDIFGDCRAEKSWQKATGKENSSFCMMTSFTIMTLKGTLAEKQVALIKGNFIFFPI